MMERTRRLFRPENSDLEEWDSLENEYFRVEPL